MVSTVSVGEIVRNTGVYSEILSAPFAMVIPATPRSPPTVPTLRECSTSSTVSCQRSVR